MDFLDNSTQSTCTESSKIEETIKNLSVLELYSYLTVRQKEGLSSILCVVEPTNQFFPYTLPFDL